MQSCQILDFWLLKINYTEFCPLNFQPKPCDFYLHIKNLSNCLTKSFYQSNPNHTLITYSNASYYYYDVIIVILNSFRSQVIWVVQIQSASSSIRFLMIWNPTIKFFTTQLNWNINFYQSLYKKSSYTKNSVPYPRIFVFYTRFGNSKY